MGGGGGVGGRRGQTRPVTVHSKLRFPARFLQEEGCRKPVSAVCASLSGPAWVSHTNLRLQGGKPCSGSNRINRKGKTRSKPTKGVKQHLHNQKNKPKNKKSTHTHTKKTTTTTTPLRLKIRKKEKQYQQAVRFSFRWRSPMFINSVRHFVSPFSTFGLLIHQCLESQTVYINSCIIVFFGSYTSF